MKWEYLRKPFSDLSNQGGAIQVDLLNFLGDYGWEMVAITNWNSRPAFLYFKREKKNDSKG